MQDEKKTDKDHHNSHKQGPVKFIRSLVEKDTEPLVLKTRHSTFSAVKRKFGDSVMSKTDTAMVNESLCKLLCHNLTCLIQEQETLGVVPIFWPNDGPLDDEATQEEGGAVLLRMRR